MTDSPPGPLGAPVAELGTAASARTERDRKRYRAVALTVAEIVFITSADGSIVHMPRWLTLTGQSKDDIREFGWLRAVHPDDRASTQAVWQRSLGTGSAYRTTYRIRMRTGAYRWFEVRASPILDDRGRIEEWIGLCIDIDDRIQAEQSQRAEAEALRDSDRRFRQLVEAIACVVWILPPSGRFEAEQPDWQAYTGQTFDEYEGDGWIGAVHPDDRAHAAAAWAASREAGGTYEVEYRLRRADGAWIPTIARGIPLLDPATGRVREWLGFNTDMSSLRGAEAELRALTEQLEQRVALRTAELHAAHRALRDANENLEATVRARTAALATANEEVQRFAYIVSHDLRAPLVNVMGFANELRVLKTELSDMLATLPADARAGLGDRPAELDRDLDEALGFILQSTGKMDRLIGAILRLSREGRRVFRIEPIDLGEIVSAIEASLAHQLQERGAVIETPAAWPPVASDHLALEQILTNLIENAVKYAAPDRPAVVRIRAEPEPAGTTLIEVEDNGRGIAPTDMQRVFELFRRAGPQDQPGEGIGLTFVQALVRRLGGELTCRSELGAGTVFSVRLPSKARGSAPGPR